MPSGRAHAKCSLYLALPAAGVGAVGGFLATRDPVVAAISAACCGLGCLLGVPLTPDLDQELINSVEYKIIKWTMGLGFVWTMLWFPYARLTAHRGFASHFPIVGTAGRLAYIALLLWLAILLTPLTLPSIPWVYVVWTVVGLVISDVAHWALDEKFGDPWEKKKRKR